MTAQLNGKLVPLEKPANVSQHARKHSSCQFPRKSVLLAWMVRREQSRQIPGKLVTRSVAKLESCETFDRAPLFEQSKVNAHRNASESENGPRPQDFELALKMGPAVRKLGGQRFVRRRSTANRRRDVRILELEAIALLGRGWLVREPDAIQRVKQEVARAISRKHAPGAIAAMRRRRESEDKQFRARVAESWHRLAPVFAIPKRQPLLARYPLAVLGQPGTLPAANDLFVQLPKPVHALSLAENYHETDVPPESSICVSEPGLRKAIQFSGSFRVKRCERFRGHLIQ